MVGDFARGFAPERAEGHPLGRPTEKLWWQNFWPERALVGRTPTFEGRELNFFFFNLDPDSVPD